MLRNILSSLKNYIFYRTERQLVYTTGTANDLESIKLDITNAMLSKVGLKVVDNDADVIPHGVYLTPVQKSYISTVSLHGYKIGLR
jgi:thymidine phosphorylase